MAEKYQKLCYDSHPAFRLHHTYGSDAGGSTLGHLHTNNTLMLIYFRQGIGSIKIEGHHYDIHPGDAILLNPSEVFLCTVASTRYHERIVLYINDRFLSGTLYSSGSLFRPFHDHRQGIGNHIPASILEEHHIDHILCQLSEAARDTTQTGQLLAFSKLIELLVNLNRIFPSEPQKALEYSKENPLVNAILAYLGQHYREVVSIEQVAATFGMSKSRLSHLFKQYVGISPWNYVILRRLHEFNFMIQDGHSIEEACWLVGFQNYSNFFRLYKKYMGMTPMQYKQESSK